jgi:hypothetical protein
MSSNLILKDEIIKKKPLIKKLVKEKKQKIGLKSDRKKPNKDKIKKYCKQKKLQLKELGPNLKN